MLATKNDDRCERIVSHYSHIVHAPMESMPQSNDPKAEIWESPPGLGLGTKLGFLDHLLICIGLSTY